MRVLSAARIEMTYVLFSLSTGTAIEISGIWKACPAGKEQTHELQTSTIRIVGDADAEVRSSHLY